MVREQKPTNQTKATFLKCSNKKLAHFYIRDKSNPIIIFHKKKPTLTSIQHQSNMKKVQRFERKERKQSEYPNSGFWREREKESIV